MNNYQHFHDTARSLGSGTITKQASTGSEKNYSDQNSQDLDVLAHSAHETSRDIRKLLTHGRASKTMLESIQPRDVDLSHPIFRIDYTLGVIDVVKGLIQDLKELQSHAANYQPQELNTVYQSQ